MDVTDVLRDRMQQPAGLQRMVAVSLLLHAALIAGVLVAPKGLLSSRAEPPRSVMTISLGGGGEGPQTGGLTPIGGRPVQVQTPPDAPVKREAVRPPAAKTPEMTVPLPNAKTLKASPAPAVKQAPDEARGRTPTRGAQVQAGTAVAETRARGQGFGLSSGGGGPGGGATLDVADFCCPEYILTMADRIKSNWDQRAATVRIPVVRFTIERNGMLTNVEVETGTGDQTADIAAQRAVLLTKQLPPLPAQFPNPTLTVHLKFQR